jgi:drug/metabolite transporter (DMT)-like permease
MTFIAALPPPDPPIHLLMPVTASLLYVMAALSLKRANEHAAGVWRSTFILNLAAAAFFALMPLFSSAGSGPWPLWQPALIAVCFIVGQACTMYALNRGDVSVATPVVGTKVVFVTFFVTWLNAQSVTSDLWISAAMSALGIALLNGGGSGAGGHRNLARTIAASLLAAACYAMVDTLVVRWGGLWGVGKLLPAVMAFSLVGSLAFIPAFEGPLRTIPRPARKPLLAGAMLLAAQAIFITLVIGLFNDTPRINVVYNARGLWSVIAVWLIGHWFSNREMHGSNGVFGWRVAGAILMLAAILVAILRPIERTWGW